MNRSVASLTSVTAASIDGVDADGRPCLALGRGSPTPAEVVWLPYTPSWPDCRGCRVLVSFEDGDESRPIVLGFLDRPALAKKPADPAPTEEPVTLPRTMKLATREELILECGKAKISLRADGRIVILGGQVVSRSTGVNRIRGGSVQIN